MRKPYGLFALAFLTCSTIEGTEINTVPKTVTEALKSNSKNFWLDAPRDELISITEMNTYDVFNQPCTGNKVVKKKWVFDLKKNDLGEIMRDKARLVAKGFT